MAPDQAALVAAGRLRKPSLWPVRGRSAGAVWGECQGSGAAPYRLCVALSDLAHRCSCPSRKLPCKHVLALLWQFAEAPAEFDHGDAPEWAAEWLRRRKPGAVATQGGEAQVSLADAPARADPGPQPRSGSPVRGAAGA